jgi:preprotein translocase subunit YajC
MGYNTGSHFFPTIYMLDSLILFAQADAPVQLPGGGGGGDNFFFFIVMLPLFFILIWFLFVNPQKKQEERLRNMLNSLEKNDKVMTVGGLIGTVHSIDKEQNEIVLKVDDTNNTRIRFHLTAVSTVFPKENAGK